MAFLAGVFVGGTLGYFLGLHLEYTAWLKIHKRSMEQVKEGTAYRAK